MHVLMIACHPRADSYSAALRDAARAALEAAGHQVRLRDLHAEGFVPVMSAADMTGTKPSACRSRSRTVCPAASSAARAASRSAAE